MIMAFSFRTSSRLRTVLTPRIAAYLTNGHDFMQPEICTTYDHQSGYDSLYPGYIPTSGFQKFLLSVGSSLITISNPLRGDMLATFGEASGAFALQRMKRHMEADPVGHQILAERPRISTKTVDLEYLRSFPDETFGKQYVTWLKNNKASPDDRLPVQFVDDPDLSYVMQRYREIHDLIHTLLGMPTTMIGEVTVKVFEGLQTGLPMCVAGGMFGTIRLKPKHLRLYLNSHLQWAVRSGLNAMPIMNIFYEKHWEQPLSEMRSFMKIEEPPATPQKKKFV